MQRKSRNKWLVQTIDVTFAENCKLPKLCFSLGKLRANCRRFAQWLSFSLRSACYQGFSHFIIEHDDDPIKMLRSGSETSGNTGIRVMAFELLVIKHRKVIFINTQSNIENWQLDRQLAFFGVDLFFFLHDGIPYNIRENWSIRRFYANRANFIDYVKKKTKKKKLICHLCCIYITLFSANRVLLLNECG